MPELDTSVFVIPKDYVKNGEERLVVLNRVRVMNFTDRIKRAVEELKRAGHPFEAIADAPWIREVEERFGRRLPAAFRVLVSSFEFPEFEVGGVTVFSNLNDASSMDITVAPFADPCMSPWLIGHDFIQFGRPDTGSYDPVCFDLSNGAHEPAVVSLDHEDILLERRKVRRTQLADSFLHLLEARL